MNGPSWNFNTDVSVHKKELIKFWKPAASGSGSNNFSKDSSTLRDLAHISGESDMIFMKILLQMYPSTRKSPLKFRSNPDPESRSWVRIRIRTPNPDHYSPWRTHAVSDCCCFYLSWKSRIDAEAVRLQWAARRLWLLLAVYEWLHNGGLVSAHGVGSFDDLSADVFCNLRHNFTPFIHLSLILNILLLR